MGAPQSPTPFDPEPTLTPLIPKQPGDCDGSGTAPAAGTTQGGTGECSVCGGRFALDANGKLENHKPASG
jgi:hypothetical protein